MPKHPSVRLALQFKRHLPTAVAIDVNRVLIVACGVVRGNRIEEIDVGGNELIDHVGDIGGKGEKEDVDAEFKLLVAGLYALEKSFQAAKALGEQGNDDRRRASFQITEVGRHTSCIWSALGS